MQQVCIETTSSPEKYSRLQRSQGEFESQGSVFTELSFSEGWDYNKNMKETRIITESEKDRKRIDTG